MYLKLNRFHRSIQLIAFIVISLQIQAGKQGQSWNFKLSNSYGYEGFGNFRVEANWGLTNLLDVGVFGQYDNSLSYKGDAQFAPYEIARSYATSFGLQSNFYPLALSFKEYTRKKARIDYWIGLKIAATTVYDKRFPGDYYYYLGVYDEQTGKYRFDRVDYTIDKKEVYTRSAITGGIGLGIARNFRNGLGIYLETSLGFYPMAALPFIDLRWGLSYIIKSK